MENDQRIPDEHKRQNVYHYYFKKEYDASELLPQPQQDKK